MSDSNRHNVNKDIPTIRLVNCPACNKRRLGKYANDDGSVDPVSEETVEVRGAQRYLEACQFCVAKYQRQDQQFVRANMKKLSQAMTKDNVPDGESDHRDFSLN